MNIHIPFSQTSPIDTTNEEVIILKFSYPPPPPPPPLFNLSAVSAINIVHAGMLLYIIDEKLSIAI